MKEFVKIKNQVVKKLENNYDIEFNKRLCGKEFDLYGEYCVRNSRYIWTKKMEVYSFQNKDKIFVKYNEIFNKDLIEEFKHWLKDNLNKLVNVDKEHMSTDITFVFVLDNVNDEIKRSMKKFKFHKSFFMGFRGWVNAKVYVYDIQKKKLISNRYGKKDKKRMEGLINTKVTGETL